MGESGPESFPYEFPGGYPSSETVQRAYDDADLNRAVQAYRFFFASVSGLAIFEGNEVLVCGRIRCSERWPPSPSTWGSP